jgi:phosphoribosylformylglycinamidine (FGAM) synthase-like enzyme
MAIAAIDEALRNVVSVGGDPGRTAVLDNFCWPRADDPRNLGALVRACQACYDAAKAFGVPFISGKDSLNNEFALDPADVGLVRRNLETRLGAVPGLAGGRLAIPYTLLISAISLIDDVGQCVSMDLKQDRSALYLIGQPTTFSRSSQKGTGFGPNAPGDVEKGLPRGACPILPDCRSRRPLFNLAMAAETHRMVARMIRERLILSVHDVSDGGVLVACAEMCLAADRSCRVHGFGGWSAKTDQPHRSPRLIGGAGEDEFGFYLGESPGLYIVEAAEERRDEFLRLANMVPSLLLATIEPPGRGGEPVFEFESGSRPVALPLGELRAAWQGTLDW